VRFFVAVNPCGRAPAGYLECVPVGLGIEVGQVWSSEGRDVEVIVADEGDVIVRDSYGWRRHLAEQDLQGGFVQAGSPKPPAHVMACRALADVEPA
jgi:hypothetical protein